MIYTPPDLCIYPWTSFSDGCYFFVKESMNWASAKQTCENLDGHLVKIDTEEENMELYKEAVRLQMTSYALVPWFGLNDISEEGNWVWTDSEKPQFTNWFPGQPTDTPPGEDCAGWHPRDAEMWHDFPCSELKGAICES